jgi:probable F420-dependent oxidoreductase
VLAPSSPILATVHPTLERLRGTVGIWTTTHEALRPAALGELTGQLESDGFSALWVPEAYGREAISGAQLLLERSAQLVVATGIASIYARDAMAAASASRTLADASGGRFVLGLGVSHRPLVERARGGKYDPPMGAMSTYLDSFGAAPVLSAEHETVVPVVLAALGPKMLRLAASRTDGAHSYLVTTEHTARARAEIGPESFLVVEQAVVLGQERDEYLRRAHEHLNVYTGLENYRTSWRRLGFGDDDFVRGGSERLCEALVVHGDAAAIGRRVDEHLAAGASHVCLQVLGSSLVDVPRREWGELGAHLSTR